MALSLSRYEQNLALVSLDHMEEHLFIIYEAGDISEDTYSLRIEACDSVRTKIKQ